MKKRQCLSGFHESYQEHNCAILGMNDVLDTEIHGTGLMVKLRRAWGDLLLVSAKDERSRVFFTSSNALRVERTRQFRKYRYKIHPFSKLRNFWDWLILHVFLLRVVLFSINTSFIYGDISNLTYNIVAVIEVLIIGDVLVNMMTGVIDEEGRRVMFDTHYIMLRYCTTRVAFHVSSAIPLQWIMYLRYGKGIRCALCKCNEFITALKLMNIISLARLYECSSYWTRERKSINVTYFFKFLRISVLGFVTLFEFNNLTDSVMVAVVIETGDPMKYPYSMMLIISKYVLSEGKPDSLSMNYLVASINRAIKALCLYSYHFADYHSISGMIVALMGYIISKLFFFWNIIEIYGYVVRIRYASDCLMINKRMTLNHVKKLQLPEAIADKVNRYYDLNFARYKIRSANLLWKSLPDVLREEMIIENNGRIISRIPYFSGWPTSLLKEIKLALKEHLYMKMDLVVEGLEQGDGMYMVHHGMLAVYTGSQETGHLIDGDFFGEVSLVTDKEMRTSSVVAVKPTLVLFLSKIDFRRIMRAHPDLFQMLKTRLRTVYKPVSGDSVTSFFTTT